VGHPVALQGDPERQPVRREADHIIGKILPGIRVETGGAVSPVNLSYLVRHGIGRFLLFEVRHLLFEFVDPLRVPLLPPLALQLQLSECLVEGGEDRPFRLEVAGSDFFCPLERHVLVEMCDAGNSRIFVDGARFVRDLKGNGRSDMPFDH